MVFVSSDYIYAATVNLLDPGFLGDFTAFQDMGQYNAQLHEYTTHQSHFEHYVSESQYISL